MTKKKPKKDDIYSEWVPRTSVTPRQLRFIESREGKTFAEKLRRFIDHHIEEEERNTL